MLIQFSSTATKTLHSQYKCWYWEEERKEDSQEGDYCLRRVAALIDSSRGSVSILQWVMRIAEVPRPRCWWFTPRTSGRPSWEWRPCTGSRSICRSRTAGCDPWDPPWSPWRRPLPSEVLLEDEFSSCRLHFVASQQIIKLKMAHEAKHLYAWRYITKTDSTCNERNKLSIIYKCEDS